MFQSNELKYYKPDRLGVYFKDNRLYFAFDASMYEKADELGVIIYDKNNSKLKIPFSPTGRRGSYYGLSIASDSPEKIYYNFYVDNQIIIDPYARAFSGTEQFGKLVSLDDIKCRVYIDDFDWEDDRNPRIPFNESILYGLNIRSYTKHKSSKVVNKGYFEGIVEKIPYFKDLGITSLVIMPCYEFDECSAQRTTAKKPKTMDEAASLAYYDNKARNALPNVWGFTQGYYFAPKSSYSKSGDAVNSFKSMIKELHNNNLEAIMQVYFPPKTSKLLIMDALRFYISEYHVDGFRINGFDIPYDLILDDGMLKDTKLWFTYVPDNLKDNLSTFSDDKYILSDNGDFKNVFRRFLKGDEGVLDLFIKYNKANPSNYAVVNYVCDYDGFTLKDLYSYERKHNEANGEYNSDGTDYNFSWNCGTEGDTRKRNITLLRNKQIKNALGLVMLGQGVPYIFGGDEFGNSRYGNNNAYCQDNEIGHIEWKDNVSSNELLEFTKRMIKLRKENGVFHMKKEFTHVDSLGIGYPDLSYHGNEAWKYDLSYNSRVIGMYFSGDYAEGKGSKSFFLGINMHWENKSIAVPKLKGGLKYKKVIDTGDCGALAKNNEVPVSSRSFVLYEVVK